MESLVVDRIINKNVLFFVDKKEMTTVTIFYEAAVRDLSLF